MLKRLTRSAHEAIEATPPMRALMGPAPTMAAAVAAIRGQGAVIAGVEARLGSADPTTRAMFSDYLPRAPLAAADLGRLGFTAPLIADARLSLEGPAAWLGFRYVVEGSSLGGALIGRHLTERAPELPRLAFFDPHANRRGAAWRAFCALLDARLVDDRSMGAAAEAALATFEALSASLEGRTS